MKKIGTANIIWKEFDNFVKTEKEHSMKKEPGWYVSVRWSVPREIQDILWSMYTKTGEGRGPGWLRMSAWGDFRV